MLFGMSLTCSSSYRVTLVVLWSANRARSGSSLELWALAKVVLKLTFLVCMPECLITRTGSISRSPPTSQASLSSAPVVLMVTWASAVMVCLPLRQPLPLQLYQLSHVRFLQVIRSQKTCIHYPFGNLSKEFCALKVYLISKWVFYLNSGTHIFIFLVK